MANGYFQLVHNVDGTYLRVTAPDSDGEAVNANEVMEYLNMQSIPYDLSVLNQGLVLTGQSLEKEVQIPLNRQFFEPKRESCRLFTAPDKMQAFVRFYAPSLGGSRMTGEELRNELAFQKIKYGIQNTNIDHFLLNPSYCTNIVIAQGLLPRHGTDAEIQYLFDTDLKVRPTLKEDGTVDFFNLNAINHCRKGDLLARLIPQDYGDYGYNIYNEIIKPREVKKLVLIPTNNVTVSADGLQLSANVNGHVMLVEGKVFVSNILTVDNVNTATGNIEYDGSVVVLGNVFTNFSVKATGDIEVRGVVEGAYLESEGSIIIARGMNGMAKGTLQAGKNIIAKFIENAKVKAAGYISTESILHSDVVAGTEISVISRKGFVMGGRICARNLIEVKILGSVMGVETVVEVGADPGIKMRIMELKKEIAELFKETKMSQPILNAMAQKIANGVKMQPDQIKYIQKLTLKTNQQSEQLEQSLEELEELEKVQEVSADAQVVVTGEVFAGTKICIGDLSMMVRSSIKYCRFIKSQGEVQMTSI